MTTPATFTQDGARRIVNAVRQWEQDNGQIAERQPVAKPATPPVMLVKTPASLPGGYSGSTALDGTVVEWVTGTAAFTTIASSVWIKSLNGEALAAGTVYNARFNGTYAQSGTTKSLFMVEASGSGLSSNYIGEMCLGWYASGSTTLSGGANGYGYTEVTVPVGPTTGGPYSDYETWRLQHGSVYNTVKGVWHCKKKDGTFEIPINPYFPSNAGISGIGYYRFMGKRGNLVSGTTYDCHSFTPLAMSLPGKVNFTDGTWSLGTTNQGFISSQMTTTDSPDNLGMAQTVIPYFNYQYNGSATGWQNAVVYSGAIKTRQEKTKAIIGFSHDVGWHIVSVPPNLLSTFNAPAVG